MQINNKGVKMEHKNLSEITTYDLLMELAKRGNENSGKITVEYGKGIAIVQSGPDSDYEDEDEESKVTPLYE